ncbi:MAG: hypothetical protein RSB59_01365 [Clostridia bacterium]
MYHKNSKRIIVAMLVVLTVVCSAVFMTACGKDDKLNNNSQKSITIYIGETSVAATTTTGNMYDLFTEMKANGKLSAFECDGSKYSAYLTKLNDLSPAKNQYIAVYHDINDMGLQEFDNTTFLVKSVVHFDKTFYFSGVGITLLPVVDGANYWFTVLSF